MDSDHGVTSAPKSGKKTRLVLLLASSGSSCGMEPITFDLNHPYRFFFSPKHLAGRAGGKSRTKNIHKP